MKERPAAYLAKNGKRWIWAVKESMWKPNLESPNRIPGVWREKNHFFKWNFFLVDKRKKKQKEARKWELLLSPHISVRISLPWSTVRFWKSPRIFTSKDLMHKALTFCSLLLWKNEMKNIKVPLFHPSHAQWTKKNPNLTSQNRRLNGAFPFSKKRWLYSFFNFKIILPNVKILSAKFFQDFMGWCALVVVGLRS